MDLGRSFRPSSGCSRRWASPCLNSLTYEADDILATIAHRTHELGGECYLVTADKDCRQLITPRVKIYNVRKDQLYDAAALLKPTGASGPSKSSIFKPWSAMRSTTFPACRSSDRKLPESGWKSSTRSNELLTACRRIATPASASRI